MLMIHLHVYFIPHLSLLLTSAHTCECHQPNIATTSQGTSITEWGNRYWGIHVQRTDHCLTKRNETVGTNYHNNRTEAWTWIICTEQWGKVFSTRCDFFNRIYNNKRGSHCKYRLFLQQHKRQKHCGLEYCKWKIREQLFFGVFLEDDICLRVKSHRQSTDWIKLPQMSIITPTVHK